MESAGVILALPLCFLPVAVNFGFSHGGQMVIRDCNSRKKEKGLFILFGRWRCKHDATIHPTYRTEEKRREEIEEHTYQHRTANPIFHVNSQRPQCPRPYHHPTTQHNGVSSQINTILLLNEWINQSISRSVKEMCWQIPHLQVKNTSSLIFLYSIFEYELCIKDKRVPTLETSCNCHRSHLICLSVSQQASQLHSITRPSSGSLIYLFSSISVYIFFFTSSFFVFGLPCNFFVVEGRRFPCLFFGGGGSGLVIFFGSWPCTF